MRRKTTSELAPFCGYLRVFADAVEFFLMRRRVMSHVSLEWREHLVDRSSRGIVMGMIVKGMNGRGMNSGRRRSANKRGRVSRHDLGRNKPKWRILALKSGVFHFKMRVRFAAKLNS